MSTKNSGLIVFCCSILLLSCGDRHVADDLTSFTKSDSLTERYLALEESMLQSWNEMINDDNKKLKAMHHLLHELMISHPENQSEFAVYEERLDQLTRLRYTQKSMANEDVVEEYDFASHSLINELISLAKSKTEYPYNITLQKLVEEIYTADKRVNNYRLKYDSIAILYNRFLEKNKQDLTDIDQSTIEKKTLFDIPSEE